MRIAPSEGWRVVSDVALAGGFVTVLTPYGGGRDTCTHAAQRGVVAAEALLTSLTATELLKRVVGRPRPYTALAPDAYDELGALADGYLAGHVTRSPDGSVTYDDDATASFPSGHTSTVAAGAFAVTTLALLSRPDRRPAAALWYLAPTALTAVTGYARVRALAHHPTDVLAGGLIGAASGVLVPLAHLPPARAGAATVSLAPTGTGLAVVGAW